MKINKLTNKIYEIFLFSFVLLSLAGCGSGGGGGGALGSTSEIAGVVGGSLGSSSNSFVGSAIVGSGSFSSPVHNPEPSSILLLGGGLIGMAIYAKARLKNRGKR